MPGSIVFKPLEAKIKDSPESVDSLDPICKFKIGFHSGKTEAALPCEGNIVWHDYVKVDMNDESFATVKLKNKGILGKTIGEGKIDLEMVLANKRMVQWIDVFDKDEVTGQILVDVQYIPPT